MDLIIKEFKNKVTYRNKKKQLHREDGPAVVHSNGTTEWYLNGLPHREDGPALFYFGNTSWFIKGELHREDGPAIEYLNGDSRYYLYGNYYSEEGWKEEVTKIKLKRILDL
jgi:hypothetical protein